MILAGFCSERLTEVYTHTFSVDYQVYTVFKLPTNTGFYLVVIQADIFLFKVNQGNTRTMCGIHSKLTIKALETHQRRRSGLSC